LKILFWNYTSESDRIVEGERMEKILFNLLQTERSPNIKKKLYRLLLSVAYSKHGREVLYDIWNGEITIDGLLLNGEDRTKLAMQLALFGHRKSKKTLKVAYNEITNEDRKSKFRFVLPSLSNSSKVRHSEMLSFNKPENRENESWVLNSLYYIHHPLRQQNSINSLRGCLDLLPEIQKTGDIFVPKDWLENTIAQYWSEDALVVLNTFLSENPQLSIELRSKLLQSADNLIRYQKMLTDVGK
jgi:aminopeptidase N